jgi:hypothetical protein
LEELPAGRAELLGAVKSLPKPFTAREMIEAVDGLLGS